MYGGGGGGGVERRCVTMIKPSPLLLSIQTEGMGRWGEGRGGGGVSRIANCILPHQLGCSQQSWQHIIPLMIHSKLASLYQPLRQWNCFKARSHSPPRAYRGRITANNFCPWSRRCGRVEVAIKTRYSRTLPSLHAVRNSHAVGRAKKFWLPKNLDRGYRGRYTWYTRGKDAVQTRNERARTCYGRG